VHLVSEFAPLDVKEDYIINSIDLVEVTDCEINIDGCAYRMLANK
jgi:hypothetical protein